MFETANGTYELEQPIDQFSGQETWPFKFVIGDLYWVEPPETAANRTQEGRGSPVNLELRVGMTTP